MTRRRALGAMIAGMLAACSPIEPRRGSPEPPDAPRELRGAWVASVSNIDWPSRPGLSIEAQQQEARALVAAARAIGINALILQVRPAADALYESRLEPWSEYLTGEQGRAPEPFYDPLAFWIEEAHGAGIELHAWFNPFRARHPSARGPLATNHVARAQPSLVKSYGDMLWMDPGDPAAGDRALAVIVDVVNRYDVDGVHVDDYFYPYPVKNAAGEEIAFPDEDSWRAYHGPLTRADWRRANIDAFVARMYAAVRAASPHVRVGISPFGIGRPDRRPEGVTGFSQYDAIFADAETWLANGWLDYLAPQLYWKRDTPGQQFAALLDYWNSQNTKARHVWPGLFTSRIDASAESWSVEDIAAEIEVARAHAARGHIHFSMSALAQDRRGIAGRLRELYATPSLVPPAPWLSRGEPAPPLVDAVVDAAAPGVVRIVTRDAPWRLAVWALYGDSWRFFILPAGQRTIAREDAGRALQSLVVSSVDRAGVESVRVRATLP